MTVIAYIYTNSLRVYQETQGLATVYETAKLINRDMRNTLGYCVPVPANSMNPQTINFQGLADATSATLDPWYLDAVAGNGDFVQVRVDDQCPGLRSAVFGLAVSHEDQRRQRSVSWLAQLRQHELFWIQLLRQYRGRRHAVAEWQLRTLRSYWMPAFFVAGAILMPPGPPPLR